MAACNNNVEVIAEEMAEELAAFKHLEHVWNTQGKAAFMRQTKKYGLGQFYKDPTREEVIVDGAYFRAFYHTDPPNDFWRSLNVQWPTDNALHLTTCSLYVDGEAPLDCYFLGMRRGKPVHILITTEDVDGMRVRLPCDQRTARRLFDAGRRHEPDNVPADSWELFAVAAEALSRAFA